MPSPREGTASGCREWVAPRIREGRLRAIGLECSYTDGRADEDLFSHLTPRWVMVTMRRLAELIFPEQGRAFEV